MAGLGYSQTGGGHWWEGSANTGEGATPQCVRTVTTTPTRPVVTGTVWSCPADRTINTTTSPPRCGKQITETTTLTATTATNTCPPTQLPTTTTRHYWTSNCPPQHRPNPDGNVYAKQYVLRNVTAGKNKIRVTSPATFMLTWATLSATDTAGATTNINSTTGPVGNVIEWTPPGGTPDATVDYLIEISRTSSTTALLGYHTIQTSLLLQTPTGLTANGYNRSNPFAPALNIQWQQVSHARGYEIKYCKDTGNNCPDNVTTRQTYCVGTNCAASGVSQITPDTNGTFTAKIAKNTTTHSALAIGQTYRIHIRAQDTQTGYQHHQSPWSDPVTTQTVQIAPPKTTGLQANGDSRSSGVPASEVTNGQAALAWNAASTADSYQIQYVQCVKARTCEALLDSDDSTILPSSGDSRIENPSHTVTGLNLDRLHAVRVRARNAAGESAWSDTVYTYPTTVPKLRNGYVGFVRILGYLPSRNYTYAICLHTIPEDLTHSPNVNERKPWIEAIVNGIATWPSTTGILTATKANDIETEDDCQRKYDDDTSNTVERVSRDEMEMRCERDDRGCAEYGFINDPTASNYGELRYTKISLANRLLSSIPPTKSCSEFYRIVQHEAGHAFGLWHPLSVRDESAMGTDYETCSPTKYDTAAIKAIYQSRS